MKINKPHNNLSSCRKELTATKSRLKKEISRRESAEGKLRQSKLHYSKLLKESDLLQGQLRHLTHQVLLDQEDDREEISRELHDDIAQTLTGINIHLASLSREAVINTKGLKKIISHTQKLVEQAVNIVHRFASDLRPTVLDDLGLIPALHSYMKDFTKRTKIPIRFTAFAGVKELSNARRTVLYRVTLSALTNIAQHADASLITVSIKKTNTTIDLCIHDNGKSFNVEDVLFIKRHKRLGLLGMKERVDMVGGHFTVDSSPGKGTTICAIIPLIKKDKVKVPLESKASPRKCLL
ncbi:MAG: histidine kinase [Verrucomicrobiota bacterium]|nr:histidine kinase [Verrucomicrobiota bacterium]